MRKNKTSKIALNILILARNPHISMADNRIRRQLEGISHVRRIDSEYGYHDSVFTDIRRKGVNTLILQVGEYFHYFGASKEELFTRSASFIERVRRDFPRVVIILFFPSAEYRSAFLAHVPGRFDHYLYQLPESSSDEVTSVVERCELWHRHQFRYEVALSFAGEDRGFVNEVAAVLKKNGARLFYDRYEQADLLGKDLYQHFQTIYRDEARHCVIFASAHYARKSWTNHELRQAQARVFAEQPDYLIPVRLDDTEIPGVNETIGFLDARKLSPPQVADVILQKLFHDSYQKEKPSTPDGLQTLKAAAVRYVAAMKGALETQKNPECSTVIEEASEYAAAKADYYQAARRAMPALLQIAKGEATDSSYGKELTEIFRDFGEDRDQEATNVLTNALENCPASVQRDHALKAVEDAQGVAKRFVEEFGGLEGV